MTTPPSNTHRRYFLKSVSPLILALGLLQSQWVWAANDKTATHSARGKLKIFILAGQSNMEGHAKVETFDYIGDDPATAPLLKMMRGGDGKPRVCDHVWISYLTGRYDGSANGEGLGKLTAGYGARGDSPTKDGEK